MKTNREDPEHKHLASRRIVLVGQPNVGKSALFNALTGSYVMVSNYPGTTVDVSRGVGRVKGQVVEIIDSPGINSLVTQSDEEKATRALLWSRPDLLVQVADSKNLVRALALTLELCEIEIPMVLCLNMKDEALSRGYRIDAAGLSRVLGIPVVETVATTRDGLEELEAAMSQSCVAKIKTSYPPEVERDIARLCANLPDEAKFLGPFLLQNHTAPEDIGPYASALSAQTWRDCDESRRKFLRPVSAIMFESRQYQSRLLAEEHSQKPNPSTDSPRLAGALAAAGRWTLLPWPGFLIAGLVLAGLYEFVGVFAAQVCVDFFEDVIFGRGINPAAVRMVQWAVPWAFFRDLLVGDYGILTMALTYAFALILPIVSAFFLALGFLEDVGYLPRLSVLLDRFFKLMGLNGKAVFPMILGFGCGTMAMLTTRILDTRKEKILVSFLLALSIPCSAQLGVILGMAAGLSSWVLALWLLILTATLISAGAVASRIVPGGSAPLLLEIPPLRVPVMSNLLKKVRARLWWYLKEVVPLFVYGTVALFFLDRLGWLKTIETFASPVITGLLGLPAEATGAFLIGFLRRDYGAAGLYHLQREGLLNLRQSAVSIVAITLFMPCLAQWIMTVRERGLKAAMIITALVTGYALIVSGALNWALVAVGL